MKLVKPSEMRSIDSTAIKSYGIPRVVLMENAALGLVREAESFINGVRSKKIAVICGKGNNGGDGFACARHLYNKGADIHVFTTGNSDDMSGDALVNFEILEKMKVPVTCIREDSTIIKELYNYLFDCDLIIDALFGTGLNGEVRGIAALIIEAVNKSGKKVISADIPSGLNGETGKVCGKLCVIADITVTFGYMKIGLVLYPGNKYSGKIVVFDIGIPEKIIDDLIIKIHYTHKRQVAAMFRERNTQSNKGDYGRVAIVSGSPGMTGSGCLAVMASLRCGAGLVYLAVPSSLSNIYSSNVIEPVIVPLNDNKTGYLSATDKEIDTLVANKDAIAIGPGIATKDQTMDLLTKIISESKCPLIFDADALNLISSNLSILSKIKYGGVITPHPGEMSRLINKSVDYVQENRLLVAKEFAEKYGVIVILKGFRTVIASPDGIIYINSTGNPGMATAGSGDVLTGIVCAISGMNSDLLGTCVTSVYLHGLAGDLAAQKKGSYGMIASDIVDNIPDAINSLNG